MRQERRHWFWTVYPETDAERSHYYCGGGLDLGLTQEGIAEAQKFAKRFKRNPLKIKRIVAAPELRAIQMADIMHDEMKGKILLISEFRDQILGELDGKPVEAGEDALEVFTNPPRGETGDTFRARVQQGLEKIVKDGIETLLVVHPRVARVMLSFYGLPNEKIKRLSMISLTLPPEQGAALIREV